MGYPHDIKSSEWREDRVVSAEARAGGLVKGELVQGERRTVNGWESENRRMGESGSPISPFLRFHSAQRVAQRSVLSGLSAADS